jgi:hypothetical protein
MMERGGQEVSKGCADSGNSPSATGGTLNRRKQPEQVSQVSGGKVAHVHAVTVRPGCCWPTDILTNLNDERTT